MTIFNVMMWPCRPLFSTAHICVPLCACAFVCVCVCLLDSRAHRACPCFLWFVLCCVRRLQHDGGVCVWLCCTNCACVSAWACVHCLLTILKSQTLAHTHTRTRGRKDVQTMARKSISSANNQNTHIQRHSLQSILRMFVLFL